MQQWQDDQESCAHPRTELLNREAHHTKVQAIEAGTGEARRGSTSKSQYPLDRSSLLPELSSTRQRQHRPSSGIATSQPAHNGQIKLLQTKWSVLNSAQIELVTTETSICSHDSADAKHHPTWKTTCPSCQWKR